MPTRSLAGERLPQPIERRNFILTALEEGHGHFIRLTEEQLEKLRTLAEQRGVSISEIVRRAVDALTQVAPSRAELRERALAVIGRFASGEGDVAAKHDAYLADAFDAKERRDGEVRPPARRRRSSKASRR